MINDFRLNLKEIWDYHSQLGRVEANSQCPNLFDLRVIAQRNITEKLVKMLLATLFYAKHYIHKLDSSFKSNFWHLCHTGAPLIFWFMGEGEES